MLQHFSAASFKFLALCTLWVPSVLPLRCCTFCPTSSALYFCFREAYQPRNLPLTVADNPFATQGKRVARSRNEQEWGGCPTFRVGSAKEQSHLLQTESIYQQLVKAKITTDQAAFFI